jgi:hypothetical protein
MPGGDRTGPRGMGPMTGRAAGVCAGNPVPGYTTPGFGRGRGFRCGSGGGPGRGGQGYGFRGRGGPGWGNSPWDSPLTQGPAAAQPRPWDQARGAQNAPADSLETLRAEAMHFGDILEKINARIDAFETSRK